MNGALSETTDDTLGTFREEPVRRLAPLALTVLGTALFYVVMVLLRASQHGGALWFVHLGSQYLQSSHDPVLTRLPSQSPVGYDGQYYFALALEPLHAHATMTGGNAGYVYSRPFYPLLARLLSAGATGRIPTAMLGINVAAAVAGTLAVALWLRGKGVTPVFALLYGLWPGLIFCVFRDLTEPLAFGLAAVAMLTFDADRTRRILLAGGLFALALLTRETVIPFVVACAATLVLADRPPRGAARRAWLRPSTWARAAAMLAAAYLPLLVWRIVLSAWLGQPTQEHGGRRWWVPFHGIAAYWPFDAQHWLITATVVAPAVTAAAVVCWSGVLRREPVLGGLFLANVLLFVVFLPVPVDVDFGAASRGAVGVVLAAAYVLPGLVESGVGRLRIAAGATLWSLAWYLVMAAALGLPTLALVTE